MKKIIAVSALALTLGFSASAFPNGGFAPQGGFNGPGLSPVTAAQAAKQSDDTAVVLVGKIEKNLGNEKYLFRDASGTIILDIDNDDWRGVNITPADTVEIHGEVDKEMLKDTEVDVDYLIKK